MNNQLFQLQASLKKESKRCAGKKKGGGTKKPVDENTVTMTWHDDLSPLRVSGSFARAYNEGRVQENTWKDGEYVSEASYTESLTEESSRQSFFVAPQEEDPVPAAFDTDLIEDAEIISETPHARTASVTGLSEDDIAGDLSAILRQPPESNNPQPAASDDFIQQVLDKNKELSNKETGTDAKQDAPPANHSHQIFDAIAKSLNYANAFDLGDFVLEKRFDQFDEEEMKGSEKKAPAPEAEQYGSQGSGARDINKEAADSLSTQHFVEDLDIINEISESQGATPGLNDKNWPLAPADLEQPSPARTRQLFGEFEYSDIPGDPGCAITIKGNWESNNIEEVEIPQLAGKTNGTTGKAMTKNVIRFNKKASKQLQRLWKAWEDAKLLDRIITYDGGFVPRHMKKKGGGCGVSLSNHAWGSAFDINAQWNGLGAEPALVGEKGCTRELVAIANQHGFYWGGHFGTKDGMHFEVAKIIEYKD